LPAGLRTRIPPFVEKRYHQRLSVTKGEWMLKRPLLFFAAFVLSAQSNPAPPASTPAPGASETFAYGHDVEQRMTVPVSIGGQGPFRFVVDTGAERTVVSRELAQMLQLSPGGDVMLASLGDVRQVPTAIIPRLDVGRRGVVDIRAPALLEENIGAQGMLGIDSLQGQRILFDFERQELRIARSRAREERWPEGTIVVRGRTRLGRMILADANVDGQKVWAIVDTGSPVTIGNAALRNRLLARGRLNPGLPVEVTTVTGFKMNVDYTQTGRIRLGGAIFSNLPIAFGDLRLFRELNLTDRPAIILGMDALQLFSRVSIDFATRRVQLMPGHSSGRQEALRVAARSGARLPPRL